MSRNSKARKPVSDAIKPNRRAVLSSLGTAGIAGCSTTSNTQHQQSPTGASAGGLSFSPSYVLWKESEGVIHAEANKAGLPSASFDTLPKAWDHAFSNALSVHVAEGEYIYSRDLYLPHRGHVHLNNPTLIPDGCNGIRTGDGQENHVYQRITGKGDIKTDARGAENGLYVYGSKNLTVDANIHFYDGNETAALNIDGGEIGSWWNYFSGLAVRGKFLKGTSGETLSNAQIFNGCQFHNTEFHHESGNSLQCQDCWFEALDVELDGISTYLQGRFERVDIDINNGRLHTIDVQHETELTINDNVEEKGNKRIEILRENNTQYRSSGVSNEPLLDVVNTGAYTNDDSSVMQVRNTYSGKGQNNMIQTIAKQNKGYHLRGVKNGGQSSDKEIEVGGDYRNDEPGKGVTVTSPNGDNQYRIRVDNDGNVISEEVSNQRDDINSFVVPQVSHSIDGNVTEEEDVKNIDVSSLDVFTGAPMEGNLWVAWDEEYLYAAAILVDEHHQVGPDSTNLWKGDAIQIGVSSGEPGAYTVMDQISFAETAAGPKAHQVQIDTSEDPPKTEIGWLESENYGFTRDDPKTVYEIGIPWSRIQASKEAEYLGLTIGIHNVGGDADQSWIQWGEGLFGGKNPSLLKPAQLE